MGEYLSTTITSPQVVAAGGTITGTIEATSPHAGYFYGVVEQYTNGMVFIPGSRSLFYKQNAVEPWKNNTARQSIVTATAEGQVGLGEVEITVPNTDCYLYVFLKELTTVVTGGNFVVGTTYQIISVGTTDFTAIGADINAAGEVFVATGVGDGTGVVCEIPDPDDDETIDYIVLELTSGVPSTTSTTIDIDSIVGMMITLMIVVMMMKIMARATKQL